MTGERGKAGRAISPIIPYNGAVSLSPRMLRLAPWFIGAGGLLLFTLGLDDRDFIHLEARFALFAQEMLRHGVSPFPTTYGEPYPDYPATGTILIDLFSLAAGRVTTLSAVLPTAAAAAMTLVFTYLIGALHSRRWGFYAVLLELSTYQFLAAARSVSLDPFVAMVTAGCFYLAYSAALLDQPGRLWLMPFGLSLGFAMRGPIGLILPAAPVIVFFLIERRWSRLAFMSALSLGLLVVWTAGLLAAARAQGGEAFVREVIHQEAIGRMAEATRHPPVYFYPVHALGAFSLSFPVAVLMAASAWGMLVRPATIEWRLARHLAAWIVVITAGLSIPSKQEIRYLLPIVPAAALLAAALLADAPASSRLQRVRQWVIRLFLLMPWIGVVAVVAACSLPRVRALLPDRAHPSLVAVLLGGIAVITLVGRQRARDDVIRDAVTVALGVTAFVAVTILIVEPVAIELNSVTPFVDQVRSRRPAAAPIAFYKIEPDSSDIKFMAALDEPIRPLFIQTVSELASQAPDAVVIAARDNFDALPPEVKARVHLVAEGRIARSHCVAFSIEMRGETLSPPAAVD
ncbi:MAG TPA: glycosyltransferase family 39 protein [Nitrospiria bacterium]|nr:glycosyltransferase family 39 protein [Nitrospiria bacterium]